MSNLSIMGDYSFVFPELKPETILKEALGVHGFYDSVVDYEVDINTGKIVGFGITAKVSRFIDILSVEQTLTVGEPDSPIFYPHKIAIIHNPEKSFEYTLMISGGCKFANWDHTLVSLASVLRNATPFWIIQHDVVEARSAFLAAIGRGNQITEQLKLGTARFS